jgi:hypothetical protein
MELINVPLLFGWGRRFLNRNPEKIEDAVIPDEKQQLRMKGLVLTHIPWLVDLWPQETVGRVGKQNHTAKDVLDEVIDELERVPDDLSIKEAPLEGNPTRERGPLSNVKLADIRRIKEDEETERDEAEEKEEVKVSYIQPISYRSPRKLKSKIPDTSHRPPREINLKAPHSYTVDIQEILKRELEYLDETLEILRIEVNYLYGKNCDNNSNVKITSLLDGLR